MKRRYFIKGMVAGIATGLAGMFGARIANAAWIAEAFEAKNISDALKGVFGTDVHEPSDLVILKAPNVAENGAMVPVEVSTNLTGLESISFLVEKNQNPLAATFNMSTNANRVLATRLKLGRSSGVLVIVRANGKLYSARKDIKVTIGGCGG